MQTALTKAYAAWSRVRRADDPVAYVHGVLIKTSSRPAAPEQQRAARTTTSRPAAPSRWTPVDRLALIGGLAEPRRRRSGGGRAALLGGPQRGRDRPDLGSASRRQEPQPPSPAPAGDALSDVPETHPVPTTRRGSQR